MDHRALHFAGHPVALCKPHAPSELRNAKEMLDVLEHRALPKSLSVLLAPPRPLPENVYDFMRSIGADTTPLSPRETLRRHATLLSDCLEYAQGALEDSRFSAKYKLSCSECVWGEVPDDMIILSQRPPDTFENEWCATKSRLMRLRKSVRRKQRLMAQALIVYDLLESGHPFQCRYVSVLRELSQSQPPLLNRYRDAFGVWWTRA